MATYTDTVQSDANAEAVTVTAIKASSDTYTEGVESRSYITSHQLTGFIDVQIDVYGSDLHFQFDDVSSDANAEASLQSERRDLVDSFEVTAKASSSIPQQVTSKTEPLVIDSASGVDSIVRAGRIRQADIQEEAAGNAPIVRQELASFVSVLSEGTASPVVVDEILRAADTIESDAYGVASEPNFFINTAYGDSTLVRATLHVSASFTDTANAESTLVSTKLRQLYRDVVNADANGDSSVVSANTKAQQEIVNDVDAVDELLNVVSEEAWVFNSWTLAFSRYTNLGVHNAHDVNGEPLFAAPSGLHEFSDTSFSDALVQFGLSNMGSMAPKRMRAVYVTTAGRGVVKLATFHGLKGNLQEAKYATPERESATPINRRISPARGHQGQYWGFRVEVTNGRQAVTRIHVLPLVTGRNL